MAVETIKIKQLTVNSKNYEIDARNLLDVNGSEKSYEDIVALINKAGRIVVLAELPAANAESYASYKDAIVLVPKSKSQTSNVKDEYVIVRSGEEGSYTYAWEKIGDTEIDLSGYVQKDVEYSEAALEGGAHTHTVSGSVTVPTVEKSTKKLAVSRTTDLALGVSDKSTVATGVKVSATDEVLGSATTFSVSGGALTGASAASKAADTWVANVPTVVDTSKFSGGSLTEGSVSGGVFSGASAASFTQGSKASFTQGSKAAWSASVDNDGVLSFSFTANGDDSFTANGDDTFVANEVGSVSAISYTAPVLTPAAIENGFYTAGSAASFTEGAFTPNVVGSVSAISVSANADDKVSAATGVAVDGTASVLNTVTITAQPVVTLDANATEGAAYVDSVTIGSTSASLASGEAASAGAHKHSVKVVSPTV